MIKIFTPLFLLFVTIRVSAQNISGIINAYTPVTAINYCNNAVTVGSSAAFAVGNEALVIEMKGAAIDTTDTPTFGTILSYGDAGNYEFVHVASITGNNITFVDRLLNQYDPTSAVQLIQVPQYASPTVNALLTCQAWNGSTGGVLVLDVSGTLTLSANMDVSGLGFLGGAVSQNIGTCNVQDYVLPTSSGQAYKGEGIVVYSNVNGGRGDLANGGGGGDMQNAGGGGGGDYAAGGNGGDACQGCCGNAAGSGGIGGRNLNYASNLLFLGGGGGGGQQNNNVGTPGANGGGIIIVKGGQITASAGVSINANGFTAASISGSPSDGEGGGGAAGIVALNVTNISGSTITVNVNGGNGGNNSAGADGPGGGGGGGGILLSNASLQSAITASLTGGMAGYNYTTNSYQNSGPGQPGAVLTNLVLAAGTIPWQVIDTPVIASNTPVCSGQTIQFTVTGNYTAADTFTWTGPNGFTSNIENASISNSSIVDTGVYTLTVSNGECAVPAASSSVIVNPVYADTVNVTLCPATSYVLPDNTVVTTAGTYTTVLQSVSGCDSNIITNVTLAPVNVIATGTASICAGGTAQLNVTGGGALGYTWTPSTGLSDSAIANPVAMPTVTTTYTVSSPVAFGNLIVNGSFTQGNVGFTSGYAYTPPPNTNQGQYWVGANASTWNGGMTSCGDHTNGTGNMMFVNGATVANVSVWCETVSVTPNTTYDFSAWVSTLTPGSLAQLQFSVNGILLGVPYTAPAATCLWQQFYATWNSGNNTTADICVLDQNTAAGANDFALDDISFAQVCTGIDSVTITVYPNYSDTINASICQNNIYTLPNGTTTTTAGTYIDTLSTIHGCDSIITTNLTVNPVPQISVFDTICMGSGQALPSGSSVNSPGIYIDTLTTVLGCDSIVTVNLYVIPPPVDTVNATICQGTSYIRPSGISVTQAGIYIDTLIATGGCDSVVITDLTVNPTSATTVNDTICQGSGFTLPNGTMETTSGTYPVTLSNQYGCDSVVTTVLTVITDSVSVNETDALCFDSTGAVTATATGGLSPYEYVLTTNGSSVDSNDSGNFPNQPAGNYVVTVTDNFGCTATGATTIKQPTPLQLSTTPVNVTCYGAHNGSVSFNATGGAGPYNFTVDGQTNSTGTFTGLDTGNFAYTITDAHGCPDTGKIIINQPQPVTISISPDSAVINLGHSIQLNASSNYDSGAIYQWSPDIGLSCVQCPNPTVATNNTLTYTVTVTVDINGNDCDADTAILVTVVPNYDLYIPNVFAPGNNGPNDVFSVFGNLPAVEFFSVLIFDRWGEKVYESNDAYFQWDGTYKGRPLAAQVLSYVIQVTFEDGHNEKLLKGTVTLLR